MKIKTREGNIRVKGELAKAILQKRKQNGWDTATHFFLGESLVGCETYAIYYNPHSRVYVVESQYGESWGVYRLGRKWALSLFKKLIIA